MFNALAKLFRSKSAPPRDPHAGDTRAGDDDHWARVEAARAAAQGKASAEAFDASLRETLRGCHPDTVAAFDAWLGGLRERANRWDLWGAAYVMNGGCSDDGFGDFRNWLVGQGRATFEAALADPESLASSELWIDADEGVSLEGLSYVALEVFEEHTGEELPPGGGAGPVRGEEWEEAELPSRFPKLAARFGG